jgi:putative peptidoglycan lipid II flippase
VPFVASSDAATAVARLHGDAPPLREVRPDVPAAVATVVHRLLSTRPADRPADAAACRTLLGAAGAGGTGDSPGGDRLATTPPGSPRPAAGTPARGTDLDHGARGRGVLVAGAVAALVVAAGAVALTRGDDEPSTAGASTMVTTVAGGDATAAVSPASDADPGTPTSAAATALAAAEPVEISTITEFDPAPGDGQEDPAGLGALVDGNPDTTWRTVCYESAFFYPKQGVGLVLTLAGPAAGQDLRITWPDGPWGVQVFVADEPATTLDAWGEPVVSRGGDDAGEARLPLGSATGDHVLVWLTQMAPSDACADNPYRGSIGELALEPSS